MSIKIPDNEVDYVYVTDCIYNNNSQVVKKLTYVEGEITKYGKDIVEYVYDEYGNIIKTYSYNSLQSNKRFYTSRAFDELGRQTMQKDATGRYATYFTYLNNSHNIATITSPDGEVIRYTYDSKENPIKISSETSEGNLTNNIAYSSDEIINMSCGNDDIGFTYNNERKISSVTVGSTELENIIYKTRDDIGAMPNNLTKVTNAKGEIFISNISKSGVYEKYYYNNDLKLSCDFDSYQRITSLVDSQINETVSYSYDTFGRIKEINSSLGNLEIYTYDYYGKIACEKYVGNLNREVSYDYENDSKRRLKKISFPSFSIAMSYDLYGRISTKTYCVGATEIYSQGQSYFEYGNILTNVPSQNTYSLPGQYIMFDYDSKGNINHIKYTNKHVYYTYDKHNRLIREDNQLLYSTIFYRYDDCGNLSKKLTIPYSENQDEPPVGTWQALTYSNGKLVKDFNNMSIAYDAIGNPVLYRGYRMSWTQGNQLISYYNSTFAYNARGRRIKKNNIDYYYDAKGKLIGSSDGMEYYYDESGVTAFKYNGNLYIYQKDVLNNVIGILDSSGNIVVKYVYDAWGNFWAYDSNGNTLSYSGRKSASNSTPNKLCDINPFKYRSYFYDYETGLYYLESRYYDPETCRFISPDSIEFANPEIINGLNLYAYCVNNPIKYVDPNGCTIILQFLVSLVSYVGMAITSIWDESVRDDMNAIGWNPFNSNEQAVLDSQKVSFYKGVPVFRTDNDRSGSFGAIFLTKGSVVDALRHERGHNQQLMMMGVINYGLMIGLPSWLEWSKRSYYERPWEITADVFGGVAERTHSQADINIGYWYLVVSSLLGPFGYFFLFGEY